MHTKLRSDSSILRSSHHALSKAAIVAIPVIAAAFFAPAQAAPASFTRTFTGFTDAFAPAEWSKATTGDGTGALSSSTMTITATNAGGGAQYQFGPTTKLDSWFNPAWNATLPNYTTDSNWKFTTGTATFNWNWALPQGTMGLVYPFQTFIGTNTPSTLWSFGGGDFTNPASYTTSGTGKTLNIVTPDSFGFRMSPTVAGLGGGPVVGTISNWSFAANYVYVPGPLPAAAALAGFAWSRKLRRRLKVAGSEA